MRALCVLLAVAGCPGCSPTAREVLGNVVTLQQGTISDLRDRRGTGPFRCYPVSPDEMVDVLEVAARRASQDGEARAPVVRVWKSSVRREVIAKERACGDVGAKDYRAPFRSAWVGIVHERLGDPTSCEVEWHATHRGPLHQGEVNWLRDMPGWVRDALRARKVTSSG